MSPPHRHMQVLLTNQVMRIRLDLSQLLICSHDDINEFS